MAVTAFLLFDFFWLHYTLLAVLLAICMIFEIEMLVHTRYVVTEDGMLRIESGRFCAGQDVGFEFDRNDEPGQIFFHSSGSVGKTSGNRLSCGRKR